MSTEMPKLTEIQFCKGLINDLVKALDNIYREPKSLGRIEVEHLIGQYDIKAWTIAKEALEHYVSAKKTWDEYNLAKGEKNALTLVPNEGVQNAEEV